MVSSGYYLVFFILSPLMALGLGRIYDKLAGNNPTVGRCLDITLNFFHLRRAHRRRRHLDAPCQRFLGIRKGEFVLLH